MGTTFIPSSLFAIAHFASVLENLCGVCSLYNRKSAVDNDIAYAKLFLQWMQQRKSSISCKAIVVVDYSCAENNFGFIIFQVNPRFPGGKDREVSRVKREAC